MKRNQQQSGKNPSPTKPYDPTHATKIMGVTIMAKDRQRWHRTRIPGTPPSNPQLLIIIIGALLIHHAMQ